MSEKTCCEMLWDCGVVEGMHDVGVWGGKLVGVLLSTYLFYSVVEPEPWVTIHNSCDHVIFKRSRLLFRVRRGGRSKSLVSKDERLS